MIRLTRLAAALMMALLTAGAALAQQGGPYAPRVMVNDRVVSNYEFTQRLRFMRLLSQGAATEEQALDALIDDRLRQDAAARLGLRVEPEAVEAAMAEFAGRANMSTAQFVQALGQNGVAAQTFRDFIESGLLWREVVRARFGPRAQVSEAEIDRAVASATREGGARVLLSEIVLRADTPETRTRALRLAERLRGEISTPEAFGAAAQRYSVAQTAGRGGRLNWTALSQLPANVRNAVLGLAPGQISEPVTVPNAIALFLLRKLDDRSTGDSETLALDYARFYLDRGTRDEAARVAAELDTCDDLYGVAKGLPEERLVREVVRLEALPEDLSLAMARLDDNETTFLGGASPSLLMLCGRTPELDDEADRAAIRQQLVNQRLASYAEGYLAELRADAIIRSP